MYVLGTDYSELCKYVSDFKYADMVSSCLSNLM